MLSHSLPQSRVISSLSRALCRVRLSVSAAALSQWAGLSSQQLAPALQRLPAYSAAALRGAVVCCTASADADIVELQLKVEGMVCDGCSSRVIEALQKLPNVRAVAVDLETKVATVQLEAASQIDAFNAMPKMIETVTGLGFEAQPHFD